MTSQNPIAKLLAAPLPPDWSVERLADQLLQVIAKRFESKRRRSPISININDLEDRQSKRLLRPLLAYLATRAAKKGDQPANVFGGVLLLERKGPKGKTVPLAVR